MGEDFGAGIVSVTECFGATFSSVAMGDDGAGFGSGDRTGECPWGGDGGGGEGDF